MHRVRFSFSKTAAVLAAALGLGTLSAPPSMADWPMFLRTQTHSSYTERSPQPPLSLKWKFGTKGPVFSSPVVSGGAVYVGSFDRSLYAVDAATGKPLWSFETGGEIISTPAVSDNRIFFGSMDGYVYALSTDGKLLWKHETGAGVAASPVVAEGKVFIASKDLYLYALSVAKGEREWRMKLIDYDKYSGVYSSPAYSDGAVFIAGKNGFIYSMSAKSGGRNWTLRTDSSIYSSPAVRDGVVYIPAYNRTLYALDSKTGKYVWRKHLGGEIAYATPVVTRDRIYVALKSGKVAAFNRADGIETASIALPDSIDSTPAVSASGLMYVGCKDGFVYAVDLKTGSIAWKHATGAGIHSSPAVVDNALYIGSEDGFLYAFEGQK